MTINAQVEDPLSIIEEEARAVARCFGVVAADEAAASLIERITLRLGGAHIYLPKRRSQDRERDHKEVVRRFNGSNLLELAREFEITPRHLRRVIAASR